jgi:hypothetical protein
MGHLNGGRRDESIYLSARRLERRLQSAKDLVKKMQRVLKLLQVKT